jgi:hypothetical protein
MLCKVFDRETVISLLKAIDPTTLDEPEYKEMSLGLKEKIRQANDTNFVWVDCQGCNPADREEFR